LPKNGPLWQEIRNRGIPMEFFDKNKKSWHFLCF
jgi:hypothetical protein